MSDWRDLPAGPELDAIIRELVAPLDPARCAVCGFPYAEKHDTGCYPDWCSMRPAPSVRYDSPPAYSTDMGAAWGLFEGLPGQSWVQRSRRSGWECGAVLPKGAEVFPADTAPLAISHAFLALHQAKEAATP